MEKRKRERFDLFDALVQEEDIEDAAIQNLLRLERQEKYLLRRPQERLRQGHERKKAEILAWFDQHMMHPIQENGVYTVRIYLLLRLENTRIETLAKACTEIERHFGSDCLITPKADLNPISLILTLTQITLHEKDIVFLHLLKENHLLSDWEQCKGSVK